MVSDEPHSRQETCALWWLNGRGALGTTSLWKEDGYFTVSRSHSYVLIRFAQSWWNCLYAFDAREKKPLVSRVSRWLRRLLKTTKKKQTNKQKHHWPFIAIRNPASIFLSRVSEIRHLQRDCTRYETEINNLEARKGGVARESEREREQTPTACLIGKTNQSEATISAPRNWGGKLE